MKKICFSLLVHEQPKLVRNQIDNIRYFCPNSDIVLYNGGYDPSLCEGLNVPTYPQSRPLSYGKLAIYLLEVMEWLIQSQFSFEYLVHLDSDALFGRRGFENLIVQEMQNHDYMGVGAGVWPHWWQPAQSLKNEWDKWRPLFGDGPVLGAFNVGQVFSKRIVEHILAFDKLHLLKKNLQEGNAFADEETVFINLAKTLGYSIKAYPQHVGQSIRYRPHFTLAEIETYLIPPNGERGYLFHPIYRNESDPAYARLMRGVI